jgi:hypothetical protein
MVGCHNKTMNLVLQNQNYDRHTLSCDAAESLSESPSRFLPFFPPMFVTGMHVASDFRSTRINSSADIGASGRISTAAVNELGSGDCDVAREDSAVVVAERDVDADSAGVVYGEGGTADANGADRAGA